MTTTDSVENKLIHVFQELRHRIRRIPHRLFVIQLPGQAFPLLNRQPSEK